MLACDHENVKPDLLVLGKNYDLACVMFLEKCASSEFLLLCDPTCEVKNGPVSTPNKSAVVPCITYQVDKHPSLFYNPYLLESSGGYNPRSFLLL